MIQDHLDRRVLGAVQFIDSTTGNRILSPLRVTATGVRFTRNRSGQYVVLSHPQLVAHTEAFLSPPGSPAVGSVEVEVNVSDPGKSYLERTSTIHLPRDADPTHAALPESLFRAIDIRLFPAPASRVEPNWAVIRATVVREGTTVGLPSSLIRVVRASDEVVLARGLSDRRGEALVPVPGIPVTTFSADEDAVVTTQVEVTLQAIFDPNLEGAPDPDVLESRAGLNDAALRRATVEHVFMQSGRPLGVVLPV